MSEEFWQHTQFKEPFDRDHTRCMVKMAYDHGLLGVADEDGVCGFIAAIKSPLLASTSAFMATELAWWVNPDKRHSKIGLNLIQLLERLCIQQEVTYLSMVFMETSMPERVKTLYESLGYKLQETVYTKVLNSGSSNYGSGSISRSGCILC